MKLGSNELSIDKDRDDGLSLRIGFGGLRSHSVDATASSSSSSSVLPAQMQPEEDVMRRNAVSSCMTETPLPPEIPEAIDWNRVIKPYYDGEQWTPSLVYHSFEGGKIPDVKTSDFYQGNTWDSVSCCEMIMRPIDVGIVWLPLFEQRLRRCGIRRFGPKMCDNVSWLRMDIYHVGWRFFLLIVINAQTQKYIGYHYVPILPDKALMLKLDA